jgi:2-methylcitrate dehydratase PrpD
MSASLLGFAANGYAFREPERALARPLILATLAVALRDVASERATIALAAFPPVRARLRASLFGRAFVTGPIDAALLNGIAAGGDDATLATPIVCAALAAAEAANQPGAAVLDAVVAGLEVALRVERALHGHVERGWDVRGTCGRLGAAIAAARAFGLGRAAVRNAFALAATAAGGLTAARGTMTEAYVAGSAAADGVEAALLARAEFTGAAAALDGRRGLAALMAAGFDGAALVAGLGERFAIASFDSGAPPAVPDRVRDAVADLERAPSLGALVAATQA